MSKDQQLQLDGILRQGSLDQAGAVAPLRAAFNELMSHVPVAPDVQQKPTTIGGVDGIEVTIEGAATDNVILYFHGGVYVIGTAIASVPLVSEAERRGPACNACRPRRRPGHPRGHPRLPHVFQGFAGLLDEAGAALDRAADFLNTQFAHAPTRAGLEEAAASRAGVRR